MCNSSGSSALITLSTEDLNNQSRQTSGRLPTKKNFVRAFDYANFEETIKALNFFFVSKVSEASAHNYACGVCSKILRLFINF